MSATHASTPQRGGYHRGGYQDRRFPNHGPSGFNGPGSHRGRGHFNNLQWVASGPGGQLEQQDSPISHNRSGSNTPQYQHSQSNEEPPFEPHYDGISRFSDDVHRAGSQSKPNSENGDAQKMPPPTREPTSTSTTPAKEGGKFSFAFKSKANPTPPTKPVPDLAQRMQVREPPRAPGMSSRAPEPSPRNRLSGSPPPNYKQDYRPDRRDRDREFHRGRGREDRRDFHPRNPRDQRREDRRFDPREVRRRDDQRPPNFRNERRRDRSPEPKRQKRIIKRIKPRAVLPEEFRDSDSVYFRKPGDESVIGAGTYGKVFKAIHIYTQDKVALKRIRMEGEKDGFPVTAVREIKLLQHLRHENIVSLLEVMVEKNECFMVFEYLSHDLTGLINHPTFTLTEPHKKDLAKQMFEGLQYLHHRGVLHRDIKAANILISNRGLLKYADFGLARFFSKSRQLDYTNRVITIWYRPPELLLGDTRYGPAVDIWSAACVFMEMFTKKAIFPGDGKELSQLHKLYGSLGTPTRTDWPGIVDMPWVELMGPTERKKRVFEDTYRDFISPGALDLVCQIFQYDPAKRPTADEVLAHPYFTAEEPGPEQATE
jgi:CTD kinase subunit alpha